MAIEIVVELKDTPPSMNKAGRALPLVQYKLKKRLQSALEQVLMASPLPRGVQRVTASAVLTFAVERRRDEGNYRWLLEKALGDALVNGGWLTDDTPDKYRFERVEFQIGRPVCTRVAIIAETGTRE